MSSRDSPQINRNAGGRRRGSTDSRSNNVSIRHARDSREIHRERRRNNNRHSIVSQYEEDEEYDDEDAANDEEDSESIATSEVRSSVSEGEYLSEYYLAFCCLRDTVSKLSTDNWTSLRSGPVDSHKMISDLVNHVDDDDLSCIMGVPPNELHALVTTWWHHILRAPSRAQATST